MSSSLTIIILVGLGTECVEDEEPVFRGRESAIYVRADDATLTGGDKDLYKEPLYDTVIPPTRSSISCVSLDKTSFEVVPCQLTWLESDAEVVPPAPAVDV